MSTSKRERNMRIHVESKIPKGRMPAPSDFKMGTSYHKVKRREELDLDPIECDKCVLCQRTDVTDNGEFLDVDTWVCYTCIELEANSIDDNEGG